MVPRARLELARLSPLPPQDSVSTSSTTWARVSISMVPAEGLEPPRAFTHEDLNLACLPIPPRRHAENDGSKTIEGAQFTRKRIVLHLCQMIFLVKA